MYLLSYEGLRLLNNMICCQTKLFEQCRGRARVTELVPHADAVNGNRYVLRSNSCNRLTKPTENVVLFDSHNSAAFLRRVH